jgi:hypothetical protein
MFPVLERKREEGYKEHEDKEVVLGSPKARIACQYPNLPKGFDLKDISKL